MGVKGVKQCRALTFINISSIIQLTMGRKVYKELPPEENEESRQRREAEHNAWLYRPMTRQQVREQQETMRRHTRHETKNRTRKAAARRAIRDSMGY